MGGKTPRGYCVACVRASGESIRFLDAPMRMRGNSFVYGQSFRARNKKRLVRASVYVFIIPCVCMFVRLRVSTCLCVSVVYVFLCFCGNSSMFVCRCVSIYKGVCVFCLSVDVRTSCHLSSLLLRLVFALPIGAKRRTGCFVISRNRCIDSNTDRDAAKYDEHCES